MSQVTDFREFLSRCGNANQYTDAQLMAALRRAEAVRYEADDDVEIIVSGDHPALPFEEENVEAATPALPPAPATGPVDFDDVGLLVHLGLDRLHAEELAGEFPQGGHLTRADFHYREAGDTAPERCQRCKYYGEEIADRLGTCHLYQELELADDDRFKLMPDVGPHMLCDAFEGEDEETEEEATEEQEQEDDGLGTDDPFAWIAQRYADSWNAIEAAGHQVPRSESEAADNQLSGSGWGIDWNGDEWEVVQYPIEYGAERSPRGGVTIKGKFYRGGQWIPSGVASSKEGQKKIKEAKEKAETPKPTGMITDVERGNARKLQDKLLGMAVVKKFVEDHGEHKPLFEGGPTAAQMKALIYPKWSNKFEELIREHGEEPPREKKATPAAKKKDDQYWREQRAAMAQIHQGLEPVFSKEHNLHDRIFYDPKEGKYYDMGSDIYLSLEEAAAFGIGPKGEKSAEKKADTKPSSHWGSKEQPYWRPGKNPTVDNVITRTNPETGEEEVLLIQRGDNSPTERGKWALPGGFHDTDAKKGESWKPGKETAEEAALRELKEETGLDADKLKGSMKPVGEYEERGRDPRDNDEAWSSSSAFKVHLTPEQAKEMDAVEGQDDAKQAKWVPVKDLAKMDLAFDHGKILKDAGVEPKGTEKAVTEDVASQIRALSGSTMANVFGTDKYDELDKHQEKLLDFVNKPENAGKFDSWQDAVEAFKTQPRRTLDKSGEDILRRMALDSHVENADFDHPQYAEMRKAAEEGRQKVRDRQDQVNSAMQAIVDPDDSRGILNSNKDAFSHMASEIRDVANGDGLLPNKGVHGAADGGLVPPGKGSRSHEITAAAKSRAAEIAAETGRPVVPIMAKDNAGIPKGWAFVESPVDIPEGKRIDNNILARALDLNGGAHFSDMAFPKGFKAGGALPYDPEADAGPVTVAMSIYGAGGKESQGGKGWIGGLGDKQDAVHAAMRSIDEKAQAAMERARKLQPPHGTVGAGGADFDEILQGESLHAFLRHLRQGKDPAAAMEEAKGDARAMIKQWNEHGTKGRVKVSSQRELDRWEGAADAGLMDAYRSVVGATEAKTSSRPTPATSSKSAKKKEPEPRQKPPEEAREYDGGPAFRDVDAKATAMRTPGLIKYLTNPKKVSRRKPWLGIAAESGWVTDGRMLFKATDAEMPAIRGAAAMTTYEPAAAKRFAAQVIPEVFPKNVEQEAADVVGSRDHDGVSQQLLRSPSGEAVIVDANLLKTIRSRYPEATIHLAKSMTGERLGPVSFKVGGETVGLLMPIADYRDFKE